MAGTIVANVINTDAGLFSTQNAYSGIAKAWVNFVGTTGAINASFNVSSVTRTGTGAYTVNFTTAMTDANYVSAVGTTVSICQTGTYLQSSLTLGCANYLGAAVDPSIATVAVFR